MPHKKLDIEWWRRTVDESAVAIAFVDNNDRFMYINRAWSILTGYGSAELVGIRKWQDITVPDDIGGDQQLKESVQSDKVGEYYIAKAYLHKDGTEINVGIFVHRHPPFGPQEGYIVFAVPREDTQIAVLRQSYDHLAYTMKTIEHQQSLFGRLEERVNGIANAVSSLERIVLQLVDNSNEHKGNITISGGLGDGHRAGRDANSGNLLAIFAFIVLGLGVVFMGGKLALDIINGKAQIENVNNRSE